MKRTKFLASGRPRGGPVPNPDVMVPGVHHNGKRKKKISKSKAAKMSHIGWAKKALADGDKQKAMIHAKKAGVSLSAVSRRKNPDSGMGMSNMVAGTKQNFPATVKGVTTAFPAFMATGFGAILPRLIGLAASENIRVMVYNRTWRKDKTLQENAAYAQMMMSAVSFVIIFFGSASLPGWKNANNEPILMGLGKWIEENRTFILAGSFGVFFLDLLNALIPRTAGGYAALARHTLSLDSPTGVAARGIFENMPREADGKLAKPDKFRIVPKSLNPRETEAAKKTPPSGTTSGILGIGDIFASPLALEAPPYIDMVPPELVEEESVALDYPMTSPRFIAPPAPQVQTPKAYLELSL